MSFLKKHWRFTVPAVVVLSVLLLGVVVLYGTHKPPEPIVVYGLPDRTADQPERINTTKLPQLASGRTPTKLIELNGHKPIEELIGEAVIEMTEESLINKSVIGEEDIADMEERREVAPPEPEFHVTLGEVAESSGMSEFQLLKIADVLPIDMNVNIASRGFIEMMDRVEKIIDNDIHEIMESADLDFSRELVLSFKDNPEGLQILVDEFLPAHIEDALRKEGILP